MKWDYKQVWRTIRPGVRRRTILLSVLVGAISGCGALLFVLGMEVVTHLCQRTMMGVHLPSPAGEHWRLPWRVADQFHPGWLVLLPALGAFASAILVRWFAPAASGDGMDATIRAFHEDEGRVPLRVGITKALSSICTIGSGGSGGREGPIAQIGAGFGSWIADRFHLRDRDRRTFMLAGTAAGIGAIFRTPLGGAISAVEILYKEDFESAALVPCVVSSVTAYTLFRMLLAIPAIGIEDPTMFVLPAIRVHTADQIWFFLALGVLCALFGRLYVRVYRTARLTVFPALAMPPILKPALGGLCVGLLALASSDILGSGAGLIQRAVDTATPGLTSQQWLSLAYGFILLALLKMLATSLTIGSGGSGGVFGPTLVIGGLVGAAAGSVAHGLVPQLDPPSLPAFVMLGMAGFFAGVASAPIGAVLMVSEMTASYTLLAPLLIVCVVSLLLVRRYSLYQNQVESRFQSPAYRRLLVTDLLADVAVNSCYHRVAMPVVSENVSAKDLRKLLADHEVLFPLTVVNDAGLPTAMLTMGSMRPVYFDEAQQGLFLVRDMATPLVTCRPEDSLASVLRKFETSNYSRIPVVSPTREGELLGYIQYQDIMVAYETELAKRRL